MPDSPDDQYDPEFAEAVRKDSKFDTELLKRQLSQPINNFDREVLAKLLADDETDPAAQPKPSLGEVVEKVFPELLDKDQQAGYWTSRPSDDVEPPLDSGGPEI
jgi:hypothetical protein